MGTLLRSCAKVCELMELSFEVLSGVSRSMGVLEVVHVPKGKGGWEFFISTGLNLGDMLSVDGDAEC